MQILTITDNFISSLFLLAPHVTLILWYSVSPGDFCYEIGNEHVYPQGGEAESFFPLNGEGGLSGEFNELGRFDDIPLSKSVQALPREVHDRGTGEKAAPAHFLH